MRVEYLIRRHRPEPPARATVSFVLSPRPAHLVGVINLAAFFGTACVTSEVLSAARW